MPLLIQVESGRSVLLVEKKRKKLTQKSVTATDCSDIPEG